MQSGENCVMNKCTVRFKRAQKVVSGDEVKKTSSGQTIEGVKWQYKGFEFDSTDSGVATDLRQRHDMVRSQLAAQRMNWKGGANEREELEVSWLIIVYVQNVKPIHSKRI